MASIVVIGGGVAGLTCAWRLQRAGHDVEVLERESVPGGRMRSEQHGDFRVECGARFVARGSPNLHAVASALNLRSRLQRPAVSRHAVLRDGRLWNVDVGSPWRALTSSGLSPGVLLQLGRLGIELARHRNLLDVSHPENAVSLDGETLAAGWRRSVGDARGRGAGGAG